MKKKTAISVFAILLLAAAAAVFYFAPKTFGKGVAPSDVDHIRVIDGTTGRHFSIRSPEDIRYIVENIQSHPMKKAGISLGKTGYGFKLTYLDANGSVILPEIILNSDDTIRKDPFFYKCSGGLCYERIKEIEAGTEG